MSRHYSDSHNNGYNDPANDATDQDHDVNRSYNSISNVSNNASASSSKAVLAALRALQDKIRRLESERAQALDETAQLRHQIKNQEIESEHVKQRDNLSAQKSLHEVRTAYERILTEKTETEIRVTKLENLNREEQLIAADLRSKIMAIEDEKHCGLLSIKDLEVEKNQLQSQILHIQQKEKDLGQTILWETKRHEEDMDVLSSKLRALQSELSTIIHEKSVVETKLIELDQLVGQLLSVNESLVVRLSGKPLPKGVSKPLLKKKKMVTLPRAASMSTVSQTASRPIASIKAADDVKNLHSMHKMYVDLAQSITNPSVGKKIRKSTGSISTGDVEKNMKAPTMIKSKKNDSIRIPTVSFDNRYQEENDMSFNSQGAARNKGDLQGVITSLEDEFSVLNEQYRHLLLSVQVQSPSVETLHAEELVSVIQRLHKKGEQLRALKSPPRGYH